MSHCNEMLRTWARFNVVGTFGIAVQFATLVLLVHAAKVQYLTATLVAVEASILHNFFWHTRWTWAGRVAGDTKHGRRLARFHLTCGGLSFATNMIFVPILVGVLGYDVLLANGVTIAVCGIANFLLSDRFAFV